MPNNPHALALPTAKAQPNIPAELHAAIRGFEPMQVIRGAVPAPAILAARSVLEALSAYHAPARPALVEAWLRKLRQGVAPSSDEDFEARLEAIQAVTSHLPSWVWNAETLMTGLRKFRFFPTAADVYDLLAPIAWRETSKLSVVKQLARCKLPEPEGDSVNITATRESATTKFPSRRGA